MKTETQPTVAINEIQQTPLAWWGDAQEKSLQLARWMSLYEAVNIIADKAEEKNIPFEKVEMSPLDIRDYMQSTEDIFLKQILKADYKIQVYFSEEEMEDSLDISLDPL